MYEFFLIGKRLEQTVAMFLLVAETAGLDLPSFFHPSTSSEPVSVNDYGAQESILPTYVAGRDGTTNRVVVPARQAGNRFLGSWKGLQIYRLCKYIGTLPHVSGTN